MGAPGILASCRPPAAGCCLIQPQVLERLSSSPAFFAPLHLSPHPEVLPLPPSPAVLCAFLVMNDPGPGLWLQQEEAADGLARAASRLLHSLPLAILDSNLVARIMPALDCWPQPAAGLRARRLARRPLCLALLPAGYLSRPWSAKSVAGNYLASPWAAAMRCLGTRATATACHAPRLLHFCQPCSPCPPPRGQVRLPFEAAAAAN